MRWCLPLILAASVLAQDDARVGVVRGRVLQISSSTIDIDTSAGKTVQCGLDQKTYMEREGQRVFAGALRTDDPVELIVDRKSGSCYARTVRIVSPNTRILATRPYRSSLEYVFPRGNVTFSGVVRRLNAHVLVLRTREEPERMVLLRDDTRYLEAGLPADFSRLAVNTRVFIRGGKNIENDLEAYQVIWGEIAGPRPEDR